MLPFQEESAVLVEENTDIPDYLPEEESPSQEQDKAVTRVGSITDGVGWLSTAANFLSRSFYWWPLPVFMSPLPIYLKRTIELQHWHLKLVPEAQLLSPCASL